MRKKKSLQVYKYFDSCYKSVLIENLTVSCSTSLEKCEESLEGKDCADKKIKVNTRNQSCRRKQCAPGQVGTSQDDQGVRYLLERSFHIVVNFHLKGVLKIPKPTERIKCI